MTLPLTQPQVVTGATWLMASCGPAIRAATAGKPYTPALVCAIACKETGFIWIPRSATMTAAALLPRLVGDASGDIKGTSRRAFPRNTAAFRAKFGDVFTAMLIGEANQARAMRGLPPAHIVYKGYGLFQYDLQHVLTDQPFFEERQWYTIEPCLARLTQVLERTFLAAGGDVHDGVRRYNGSGPAAETYADHVLAYADWLMLSSGW